MDRNKDLQAKEAILKAVALHPEGVDRNYGMYKQLFYGFVWSPSTRRAWIEILRYMDI